MFQLKILHEIKTTQKIKRKYKIVLKTKTLILRWILFNSAKILDHLKRQLDFVSIIKQHF